MNLLAKRRVKIVCTLGPSSQTEEQIFALIESGMDVARLNFSHGSHDFHAGLIRSVRKSAHRANRSVAILQDLQGPKIRAGLLPREGILIKPGDVLLLYPEGAAIRSSLKGKIAVPISAEIAHSVASDAQIGARILFDDGRIITHVRAISVPEITVEVEVGAKLTSHKGMNLPGTPLSIPCLTAKDLEDLKFGLSQKVDLVALSFVRSAADILKLRSEIKKSGSFSPYIIPKIEREEAVDLKSQEQIIDLSDGLMIARGDMAVELGAERVPVIQKQLIFSCNQKGVPVITATQMLESMISAPTPTRAEASDVANAVFDGTDAVMLSGETAAGQYPEEVVRTMSRIVLEAERVQESYGRHQHSQPDEVNSLSNVSWVDALEAGAANVASQVNAVAIACISHSGKAVRTLSKYRPRVPIVAITEDPESLRKLALVWGVQGELVEKIGSTESLFKTVDRVLISRNLAKPGDTVIVTAGLPTLGQGTTNMLKIHTVASLASQ